MDEKIQQTLTRGVENIFPNKEFLQKELASGRKLRIYYGIDPTGPTLHIGHCCTLLKLRDFQELGHQIIFLIGGFTATIGDPTDKNATRVKQTFEDVKENARLYKEQAGRVLDMDKVEFRDNSEWFGKMGFADVLELASEFTVSRLLERDMFQKRVSAGEPVYLHELMYPTMQGYDSLALEADVEVGGNDQTFNMLAGRDLLARRGKEKFVVAGKLLTDPTGKKMGKTEGNMVALTDTPVDMFGKVMSWPDTLLPLAFEICTRLPLVEVENILAGNQKDAKMRLGEEIVNLFASGGGDVARRDWTNTFVNKGVPEDTKTAIVSPADKLLDVLLEHGLVPSKAQFRRLVDEGAIRILDQDGKEEGRVSDYDTRAPTDRVIKVGKLRFLRVVGSRD
ncbi:MAG: tyrosine--tRNA ligase [Candidatus Vogelbacteria bacterium CG10_big_fil_rev_8_21_14_0_10_45_14]|uniref:Tyrosine--tRNA ligase n=1 Tax=Candidatus Vogelbacteria bacterium CG10_big_fil_rev_8_21_14_0_10_45_14 TaxID=1975042 RepID=A0A2H0RIL7_9BACT|nr:MAG: tyrosine--tRNA ligase [Candidatus Vogelbacteria bacterium CG10_big_fil_rev_8_21_14_0_10_45_14]